MLIVYKDNGFVDQVIMVGDFARLQPIYEKNGFKTVLGVGIKDPARIWVKDGAVELRPNVEVIGEVRPIKADGVDALRFEVNPKVYKVAVKLDDVVVHQEDGTDGKLEFATDHPGTYTLLFDAEFPYFPTEIQVEAR